MIGRRALSLVLGLLLANATWLGGGRACIDRPHGADMPNTETAAGHHHATPADDAPRHSSNDNAPVARCCASLASCATTLAIAHPLDHRPIDDGSVRIAPALFGMVSIGLRAPEPPPPKV
jgi:hypothetical protein